MKDWLPPLQGMYYFHIAAERKSFKLASEQLFVTAAAISQQIRLLEQHLECELFERQHRKVCLTQEGEILFRSTQKAFAELHHGLSMLQQDPTPDRLSISTHPTFAQHWLIPRITRFREQHSELALLIDPKNELVDFKQGAIDLCIRYGRGVYEDVQVHWLMDEVLYPVCHPDFQEKYQVYQLDDLKRVDLIEDVWPDMDWQSFFSCMKLGDAQVSLKYDGSQYVTEGALAAQGVALVKHSLAYRYLQEKSLVRIGNKAVKSNYSYYLCAPKAHFQREKINQFIAWINKEVADFQTLPNSQFNLLSLETDENGVVLV
ncbi:LysR substrate-binding domain-containing protein [Vibrio sp.]|nr:LysR substrate-binding domain-containing protein [Vibrio sp.]